ncbi:MAG: sulfite exporter TauE/SafE family protein [Acidimicrobiales bacterium]
MVTLGTIAATSCIVLVAAALQRAVGFGFALLAVPLMAFVVPTKSAVVIVFLNGTVTSTWLLIRLRHQVEWHTTRLLGAGTVVGAPAGVVILTVVSAMTLRLTLGVVTCVAAAWIIISSRWSNRPVLTARAPRTVALGVASGVLNTSLATNGPPLVYELRRSGFRDDGFRATISAAFVISNVIGLPLLAAAGLVTTLDLSLAAASLVPCLIGIALGSWISTRMETAHFIWAADLLLLATGAVTITKAIS